MATHDRTSAAGGDDLIDRMSEGFVAVNEEWTVTICNDRARTILGFSGVTATGIELWELLPEAVGTPLYERCQRAMEQGTREIFETELACVDAILSVRCYPTDGGLSVYVRNVSLSRHRETELTRYVTVVEAVSDGIAVFDEAGEITMVNEALETLLDVTRGEIIGRVVSELDDATALTTADVTTLADAVEAIHEGATERQLDLHVSSDDRSALELRLVSLPTGPRGAVAGVFRDITARYERERVVTALHDATRQLFERTDPRAICAAAVQTSADVLDLPVSGIWLLDEEYNRLDPVAATTGARKSFGGLPQFTEMEGPAWDVFRTGEPALYHDVSEASGDCNADRSVRSELIVPIGDRGVLMAADPAAGAFDDHDLELAELLAAHTEVALERGERERLLGSRTTELERQSDRLRTIEHVLTGPLDAALSELDATLEEESDASTHLETVTRLLADAEHVAGEFDETTVKEPCSVATVVTAAADSLAAPPALDVSIDGTVRADRDRLTRLFVAVLRIANRNGEATVRVTADGTAERRHGTDALVIESDCQPPSNATATPPFDSSTGELRPGIELAVAGRIARDHDWTFDLEATDPGTRVRIGDVTTLSVSNREHT